MKIAFVIIIVACARDLFSLAPWAHIPGVFNVSDVGIALLMLSIVAIFLRHRDIGVIVNPISWLIILYFFMAAIQASLAAFNYGQSIFNGLIAIRHQLYYLSFFVFLYLFNSFEDIRKTLNALSILAIILFALALVNYAGVVIFHHRLAEGHGIRGGVVRGFIPGMDVISLALMWFASAWGTVVSSWKSNFGAAIMIGAHLFRQTRSRIVAATAVIVAILIYRKQYKMLLLLGAFSVVSIAVVQVFLPSNFVSHLYSTTFTDITEEEGTWEARRSQVDSSWNIFLENPVFGSGALALRDDGSLRLTGSDYSFDLVAAIDDLGYVHWLKVYGIVGLIWLIAFLYVLWRYLRRALRRTSEEYINIPLFLVSYTMFVVISMITLNHFMLERRIVLVCLVAAMAVRIDQITKSKRV